MSDILKFSERYQDSMHPNSIPTAIQLLQKKEREVKADLFAVSKFENYPTLRWYFRSLNRELRRIRRVIDRLRLV